MTSTVKGVRSKEELDGILKEGRGLPAILHFWAEWCEASKQMDRVFSHLCQIPLMLSFFGLKLNNNQSFGGNKIVLQNC